MFGSKQMRGHGCMHGRARKGPPPVSPTLQLVEQDRRPFAEIVEVQLAVQK